MIAPALAPARPHRKLRSLFRRLRADQSGLGLTEFAMSLPILVILTMSGLELANYVLTTKRVGEIAVLVADNASRMGADSVISNKPISEAEINDVFTGADMQGSGLSLSTNGRIILSSLQQNDAKNGQTIKWQRCYGTLVHPSTWGVQGAGASDASLQGMGPAGKQISASAGTQVMVVEISYHYKRIMPLVQLPLSDINDLIAFNVRDSRDPGMPTNSENVTAAACT